MDAIRTARRLFVGCLTPWLVYGLAAQQKPVSPTVASQNQASPAAPVEAQAILLPVVVLDKKGAILTLSKDDFTLVVDGKPQAIQSFDKESGRALSLGMIVDTGPTQRNALDQVRTASGTFIDQMLAPSGGKAFLVQFSRQTELLQDLTASIPLLQSALKEIGTPTIGADSNDSASGSSGDASGSSGNAGGSATKDSASTHRAPSTLYDAIFLACDEIMSKPAGRKVLVILSDGVDSGSKETLDHAIEAAQRADTMIYGIYFRGEAFHQAGINPRRDDTYPYPGGYPGGGYPGGGYPGGGYPGGGYPGGYPGGGYPGSTNPTGSTASRRNIDGRKVLERMAQETGGRVFDVKKNQDIAQIYTEIADELHAQYRLTFIPSPEVSHSGFRQVDLTARQKGVTVQTRDGYYAAK